MQGTGTEINSHNILSNTRSSNKNLLIIPAIKFLRRAFLSRGLYVVVISACKKNYIRVSFCDGSFYDDSLVWPLSSRTEHSRLVVRHCRNSSFLSLLSALLALFWCACVSSFFYFTAVLLSWLWFFPPRQKDRKEEKIKTADVTFFLDVFWTTAWAFFNKIKSDLIDILRTICVIFYIPNSLN